MVSKKPKTNPITDPSKFVKEMGKTAYRIAKDPSKAFSKPKPKAKLKPKVPKR